MTKDTKHPDIEELRAVGAGLAGKATQQLVDEFRLSLQVWRDSAHPEWTPVLIAAVTTNECTGGVRHGDHRPILPAHVVLAIKEWARRHPEVASQLADL